MAGGLLAGNGSTSQHGSLDKKRSEFPQGSEGDGRAGFGSENRPLRSPCMGRWTDGAARGHAGGRSQRLSPGTTGYAEQAAGFVGGVTLISSARAGLLRQIWLQGSLPVCEIASRGSFSKDDADAVAPAFINPDERPFDVGRDVAQDRIGGGMNVQSGSDQKKKRIFRRQLALGKISVPLEL